MGFNHKKEINSWTVLPNSVWGGGGDLNHIGAL